MISVIVPIYNVEKYLNRCIDSIVTQTYKKLEIILVNDGSTDNCPQICDEWAKKENRIRVIHKKNGGLSDARNVGVKNATGEYISFVDSDDWLAKDVYQKLIDNIQLTEADIVACGVEMVWEEDNHSKKLTLDGDWILEKEEALIAIIDETILKQPVWYKLYRRNVISEIMFEVGKCHEDVFWSYRAIANAKTVSIIEDVGYYYFQRKGSIMGSTYSLKRLDAIEAKCIRQDFLEKHFPQIKKKGICDLWLSCIYNGQQAIECLMTEEKAIVFDFLETVRKKYPISLNDLQELPWKQKVWIIIAKISLKLVCKLRNILEIGF